MKPLSLSVVVPAYNEEANLSGVVDGLVRVLSGATKAYEIIIVDDGSTDGTRALAEKLAKKNPCTRVLTHPKNLGFGEAEKTGYGAARLEFVTLIPADNQFHAEQILPFLPLAEGFDVVAGYRKKRNDPFLRVLTAAVYSRVVNLLFGVPVRDIDWVKLYRAKPLQSLSICSHSCFVDAEILIRLHRQGARFAEIPVEHFPRKKGQATGVNLRRVLDTVAELIRFRLSG